MTRIRTICSAALDSVNTEFSATRRISGVIATYLCIRTIFITTTSETSHRLIFKTSSYVHRIVSKRPLKLTKNSIEADDQELLTCVRWLMRCCIWIVRGSNGATFHQIFLHLERFATTLTNGPGMERGNASIPHSVSRCARQMAAIQNQRRASLTVKP